MTRASVDILTEPPPPDADLRLVYGREPLQFGDLRLPASAGPHPLAVVLHGGYWQAIHNLTHTGHLCVDLAAHGIATWNVEYRRIGDPGAGWPGTFDDVAAALRYVRELARDHPVDPDRLVVLGHSAGGHLALWAAARGDVPVRAVVSLAGVTDLHETAAHGDDHGLAARLLGGGPDELPDRWAQASPRRLLPLGVRQVIACGTDDPHLESNAAYAEAARAAGDPVEFVPLPGAGHFELVDPLAAEWAVVRGLIQALL